MTIASTSRIAAGWYTDPTDSRITRWWDGTNWTMNVCRAPERPLTQAVPPVLSAVPAPAAPAAVAPAAVAVAPTVAPVPAASASPFVPVLAPTYPAPTAASAASAAPAAPSSPSATPSPDPMAQAIVDTAVARTGVTPPPKVVSAIEELALLMEANASRGSRMNAPGLHATAGAFLGNPDQNFSDNGMSSNTIDQSDIGNRTVGLGAGLQFTFRSKPAITAAIIVIGIAAIIIYKLSGN